MTEQCIFKQNIKVNFNSNVFVLAFTNFCIKTFRVANVRKSHSRVCAINQPVNCEPSLSSSYKQNNEEENWCVRKNIISICGGGSWEIMICASRSMHGHVYHIDNIHHPVDSPGIEKTTVENVLNPKLNSKSDTLVNQYTSRPTSEIVYCYVPLNTHTFHTQLNRSWQNISSSFST